MNGTILVLNAGSSSIKFSLFPADARPVRRDLLCDGQTEGIRRRVHFSAKDAAGNPLVEQHLDGGTDYEAALAVLLRWLDESFGERRVAAVGHRVVHGGTRYAAPVLIDASVTAELKRLIPLALLHQPHHLAAIAAIAKLHPGLPQVACFDTAFHHGQPAIAAAFALPRRLTEEGVRRYGFHGLSYEDIAGILPEYLGPTAAEDRVVVAHLGSLASLCAMRSRRSVATTMGFTALDGLMMSRRCGALDPGGDLLYQESGLYGVSGISDDMRTLLASSDPRATEAIDLFVYRIVRELGSLAAALGGLDAVVFTAGIGEHAVEIRRRVCEDAASLGIEFDAATNAKGGPRITQSGSRATAWVIPTDEDLMIARHTWTVLDAVR